MLLAILPLLVATPERAEVPRPGRLDNLGSYPRRDCAFCDNDGWVVYALRPVRETAESLVLKAEALKQKRKPPEAPVEGFEELAPCPHCARGAVIEFQNGEKPGPWGREGFWRGRSTADLRPRVTSSSRMSQEDQRAHLRALKRTLGFVDDAVESVDVVNAEPGP